MTIAEILQSVQFVVDQEGKPTAAILDMSAWETFLSVLEDAEDIKLVRERMANWRTKEGWTAWEDFKAESTSS
ncbi:MAG: hypothetical protein DPW09_04645 [Anaerolineae bacterium]|nr:hypothetical protein [Anaerolineales bacterium]MCQ3972720.1 hypothetical protein [Anaerolineae bacterium]